jgi:hypothetical protein
MSENRGYYSLIQFCPDPSRLEGVNIGVVLYSVSEKRIQVQISRDNRRIRRFFGDQDWNLVNRAKSSIENQLRSQQFVNIGELEAYIAKRANIIQITSPRPMRVVDLETDITNLYKRLVGDEPGERKRRIDSQLTDKLFEAGVVELVKKSVSVEIPGFKRSIRVPYGYQNGRYNLISPVQFDSDPEALFTKTGKNAIEGKLLYDNQHMTLGDMRLVVVANFSEQIEKSTRELVKSIFDEHHVTLHSFENLAPLMDDIRRSAELHSVHVGD